MSKGEVKDKDEGQRRHEAVVRPKAKTLWTFKEIKLNKGVKEKLKDRDEKPGQGEGTRGKPRPRQLHQIKEKT